MKYIKSLRLLMLLAFSAVLVVSCSDENSLTETIDPGVLTPTETTPQNDLLARSTTLTNGDGLHFDCFHIDFPFDLVDEAGSTYTITNENDFINLGTDSVIIVDFAYPVTITYEDGTTLDVSDAEELGSAFANCLPNEWDETLFPAYNISDETSCFTLSYPVDLVDFNGEISMVNNEADFIAAISAEPLFFSFPITLIDEQGNTLMVTNSDELVTTLISCNDLELDTNVWVNDSLDWGGSFEYIGCYLLNFPFDVQLIDGSTVTVNNHMEYCDFLLQGSIIDLAYPITLTDYEGNTITINSPEALQEALDDCYVDGGGGTTNGNEEALILFFIASSIDSMNTIGTECYQVSYPFDLTEIDENGNVLQTVSINSIEEFSSLPGLLEGTQTYTIVFPLTFINGIGEIVVINSIEEVFEILSDC